MKIYTKSGDDGKSSLIVGTRIDKCDIIFDVLGFIDELSSAIGLVKAADSKNIFYAFLEEIQLTLMKIMSGLASDNSAEYRISDADIESLESKIDEYYSLTGEKFEFILPGGNELSARLDLARTIARRVERILVEAKNKYCVDCLCIVYLNRLSDYLYAAARYADTI